MVKEAERRQRKFEAKVDAEVLSKQTKALKPLMVKGEAEYFPSITDLETRIKALVEAEGVTTLEVRDYLNFGREMLRLSKKFQATTLRAEAQGKLDKWSSRGLSGLRLKSIARLVGVELEGYEAITSPFDFMKEGSYYTSMAIVNYASVILLNYWRILNASVYPLTRKCKFDRLGFYNYVAQTGGKTRLGVYASDVKTRFPTQLLLDTGLLDCSSIGWKEATIELTLDKGLYYLALTMSHSTMRSKSFTYALRILGSQSIVVQPEYPTQSYGRTYVYDIINDPLPDPFPTPDGESYYIPLQALRLKELL